MVRGNLIELKECTSSHVVSDRELPRCMACGQTGQTCNYPLRPMKPGPKIGKEYYRHQLDID